MNIKDALNPFNSPGIDYAAPAVPRITPYEHLEKSIEASAPTEYAQINSEWQSKMQAEKVERIKQFEQEMAQVNETVQSADTVTGALLGVKDMYRNTYNGIVDGMDAVENMAASFGIGTGDLITESAKWDGSMGSYQPMSDKEVAAGLDTRGKIARAVTQFASPFITAMATGGGTAAAATASGLYNFFAIDPEQERLSDALKGTGVEDVPVVGSVVDFLQTKPDDTTLDSRMKNVLEGAGIDTAIGMTLWGVSKAYPKIVAANKALGERGSTGVPDGHPRQQEIDELAEQLFAAENPQVYGQTTLPMRAADDITNPEGQLTGELPVTLPRGGRRLSPEERAQHEALATYDNNIWLAERSASMGDAAKAQEYYARAGDAKNNIDTRIANEIQFQDALGKQAESNAAKMAQGKLTPSQTGDVQTSFNIPTEIASQLPSVPVNIRGKDYTIRTSSIPSLGTSIIAVDPEGKNVGRLTLHFERSFANGKISRKLAPRYIESEVPGMGIELMKYARTNIGEVQPSNTLTSKGRAFTNKAEKRVREQGIKQYRAQAASMLGIEDVQAPDPAQLSFNMDVPPGTRDEYLDIVIPDDATPEERIAIYEQYFADADVAEQGEALSALEAMGYQQPGASIVTSTGLNLSDTRLEKAYEIIQQNMDVNVLRTPMSDADTSKIANVMKDDPNFLDNLLNWKAGDRPWTDVETLGFKHLFKLADDSYQKAVLDMAMMPDSEAAAIKFMRETESYMRLNEIREGVASAKGATLRAEQVLGQLAGTGDVAAMAAIGAEGRAKMMSDMIKNYGGKEQIKNIAKSAKAIADLAAISRLPNEHFASMMGEVAKRTKFQQIGDAMTSIALNGMLSSPGTSFKAVVTNAATNVKTIFDNYVAVGTGALLRSQDRKTVAEANAYAASAFQGLLEAIEPAWNTIKTGQGQGVRHDLVDVLKNTTSEDAFDKASGAFATTLGRTTKILTADALPVRVLMGVDTYWHKVAYDGAINAEAVRAANKLNLQGRELADFVEMYKAKPPEGVVEAANTLASTNTMAKELSGLGARLSEAIQDVNEDYLPVAKVLVPFVKTNFNLVEYTVKNTPFGFISPDVRRAFAQGGRERDAVMAKMMTGGAAIAGFTYLAMNGLTNGKNSDNLEINLALADNKTVAPETSIRFGDQWVSVKGLEPISTFLELGQTLSKASGYLSAEEYGQLATTSMLMMSEAFVPETLTDSLSGVLNVIAGKEEAPKYLASIPERFIPFGGAARDVRQLNDPIQRATSIGKIDDVKQFIDTVKMRFSNINPFYSKTLPAQRNLWGETLVLPDAIGPDVISPFATTSNEGMALKQTLEAMDEFSNIPGNFGLAKLDVSLPPRSINNPFAGAGSTRYELSPKEYSRFQLYSAGVNPNDGTALSSAGTLKEQVHSFLEQRGVLGVTAEQLVRNGFTAQDYTATIVGVQKLILSWRKAAVSYMYAEDVTRDNLWNQAQEVNQFNELGGSDVGQ